MIRFPKDLPVPEGENSPEVDSLLDSLKSDTRRAHERLKRRKLQMLMRILNRNNELAETEIELEPDEIGKFVNWLPHATIKRILDNPEQEYELVELAREFQQEKRNRQSLWERISKAS